MNANELTRLESTLGQMLGGTFETYYSQHTKTTTIRYTDPYGKVDELDLDDMTLRTAAAPYVIIQTVVNHFTPKSFDEKVIQAIGDGTSPEEKRIADINHELDIIRGRVPTPEGYIIDIQHAKDLMVELRELTKDNE